MDSEELQNNRNFLKDELRLQIDFRQTDQSRGVEPPPLQKPAAKGRQLIPLPGQDEWSAYRPTDLLEAISNRRSHRRFKDEPLSLNELALLLWATQGVKRVLAPSSALRTVPSAGCRHAFETYLLVNNIEQLASGCYRYLPIEHALVLEEEIPRERLQPTLNQATLGQAFVASAPVTFVWTAIPYRMEWRYHTAAHRVILLDAGHLCQNLYLAAEAIGAGTCAIAAYHQQQMDQLLRVDGNNEFCIYLAPVGKV